MNKLLYKLTHLTFTILFTLQAVLYPWISVLPAPPPAYAQESPPSEASYSATTPAPSPLDPLLDLDTIFPSTTSAQTIPPEEVPEATQSALPEAIPEPPVSTPSASPSTSPPPSSIPSPTPSETAIPSPSPTSDTVSPPGNPSPSPSESGLTDSLDNGFTDSSLVLNPFLISLAYPFTGTYPVSYYFGQTSNSSYVRLMQSVFGVTAHDGIDFGMDEGVEILASDKGTVTHAGPGLYGETVILKHTWGNSYYGHLSKISVKVGDQLGTGSLLGLSGSTGVSTGPHLHFGIRPNHYDPYNGYHGMIDPLPYLNGSILGVTQKITKTTFAHIHKPTLLSEEESVGILLTQDPSSLTFSLRNPQGESKFIYPTIYNFGTGETALITRPNPFIPGRYTLTITRDDGAYDEQTLDWGVLTLNTDQASYSPGSLVNFSLAVLDHAGEMVCDADLSLTITDPAGEQSKLTTPQDIAVNLRTCQSKDLTLTPDYHTTYLAQNSGTYALTLTATTHGGTYSVNDSFEVKDDLPFKLNRVSATRIYPAHRYPVIFELTTQESYQGTFSEIVPPNFQLQPLSLDELKDWTQVKDESSLLTQAYTQQDDSLIWDIDLQAQTTYYFGYSYDAPDESPRLYTLGPASIGDYQESRSWNIAVDAVTSHLGFFSPPTTWTTALNANLALAQPDPRDGDLMIASIAIRPSASTVNTPSGWTLLDNRVGTDGGSEGVDTGSVRVYTFSKVADGSEGSTTVTFTENGTTSIWIGNIQKIRSATGTYDVAVSGYSLDGDATNWGGTLDSDIGLTAGDLVITYAAQNGDLSNTSNWGLSATGITSQSSSNEHGEYTTTAGTDLEMGLATTQIWEGTNTATPTIAVTQSVASSGVVMAVRIRQGSGSNRTDSWVRAAGPQVAGTSSVIVPFPEHEPGDLLLLFVASRQTSGNTPNTPVGWTNLGSYNGGTGTFGADAGDARITVFYLQAGLRFTGTQTVTITSGNSAIGQMLSLHHDGNVNWVLDEDGGVDSTAGTGWSATGSGIDLDSANGGDLVLVGSATNTDAYSYSAPDLTASGVGIGEVTLTGQFVTSSGNDSALTVATARITSGSGSPAPTYTMTSSGSGASSPTGSSMFIKVNTTSITTSDNHLGFFSPPATWTSAGNTNLNLAQPDPRDGDLMIATLAIRPSSSTINTPSGWSLIDYRTATDGGGEGADAGSVGLYTFSKVADGSEGSSTVAFTENGSTSVWIGNISQVRSATGTYDISGSSYAIDGDNTDWSGTLASDIGLTQGDLVLIFASQNGDLSNTSGWGLSASGITNISSVNEHGEYLSTTGNDVEVGLATAQIWEGTNTATPTIAVTQSVASSGVVMAVRIRQGSGTNRTDNWVRSAGPQAPGTSSVAVVYPEHEIGDLLLLFVASRITSNATPTTPSGWTSLGSYNGGTGTFGADAGNARTTVFYAQAGTRMTGVATVALTSGNSMIGQIVAIHNDNDDVIWELDSDGGVDSTSGTSWSVTGDGIDLSSSGGGDIVLIGSATNTDAYSYNTPDLTASGVTIGDVTMTSQFVTGNGNDSALALATARITAGSGSPAPTYTMTSSGSGASSPTGSSMFIKVNSVVAEITISGTANGNNGATVKYSINSTPGSETDTISGGTWEITGIAPPTVGDVITVWVDNVSDSNESTAVTKWATGSISGMVLDTNVFTVGSNQNQSLSLTDLATYDCSDDEDVMHLVASSHLKVEGDACAGSTTNSYTSEELEILTGNTLTLTTSETLTTYDLTISGTLTSSGNSTYNVSHDWTNPGTFTPATSTVNLTGADSTTQTLSGSTSFYNLSATTTANSTGRTVRYTAGTTQTVIGTWTMQGASGKILTLESSTTSAWSINPTSATIGYLSVSYSTNLGSLLCAPYSTDGNNNTGYSFSAGSTCAHATGYSFQRKTWHDGIYYWRAFYNATTGRIEFEYSDTGASWSENASARISVPTNDFSLDADDTRAFIAYQNGYHVSTAQATSYPATNFAWGTPVNAFTGTGSSDAFYYPYLTRSSASVVWVNATHTESANYHFKAISATSANSISAWNSPHLLWTTTNSNVYGTISRRPSSDMYATWIDDATIQGCVWDNDDTGGRWEDSDDIACGAGGGGGDDWLSGWANRIEVTVSNTNIDSNLTHYPLLLTLGGAVGTNSKDITAVFDELGSNSKKIALTKDDGLTQIYTEIETWDESSEQAWLWVSKSDLTLSSSTPTTLYLYYDSTQADNTTYVGDTNSSPAEAVWDSNYLAVHHFGATSGTYYDSTSNNNDSTSISVTSRTANSSCRVGNCPEFNGASNTIALTENNTLDLTNSLTIQATIDADGYGSSGGPTIVSKHWTTYEFYLDSPTTMHLYGDSAGIYADSSSSSFSFDIFQNLAVTYDNASVNFFTNSVAQGTDSYSGSFSTNDQSLYIGSDKDVDNVFDGHIDELRISSNVRSAAWLKADYHSLTDNLVSWGDPETSPVGSTDSIATSLSGLSHTFSTLSDGSGNVHLLYLNASGHTLYRNYTSSWQTPVTLDSNAGNDYPSLTQDTDNNTLYAFWIRGDDIYYKVGASPFGSGDWDTTATTWQTSGTNTHLTSNYSGADDIFALWHDGEEIQWARIGVSNSAPNTPTSLLQTTTSDVTLSTGDWHTSTSIKFSATATDPDNPDTLQLCIEIDPLGTGFSNTEDSCGSGASYTGSGLTLTHTIVVSDAQEYHWQARIKDVGGLYSAWVSYGGNAESARDVGVDSTAPTGGVVYDGTSTGVDITFATSSLSSLSANWDSFNTDVSGLARYDYSIGTSAGATDVKTWTDNSTTTSVTATGLTLQTSQIYYVNVRAVDNAGNVQSGVSSNGQMVAPSLSFAITPATTTFSNLSAGNNYEDTALTTLTTSTNAYNGYVIRAFTTDLLKSFGGTHQIDNFSAGTYASPATWVGSETGFGYTSSDDNVQGSNKFGSGTLFAPFSQTGPGDILADHTANVTGTSISNQSFDITYKVKVPANQSATAYSTTIIYTATAQY